MFLARLENQIVDVVRNFGLLDIAAKRPHVNFLMEKPKKRVTNVIL